MQIGFINNRQGFSLVEVLISTSIMAVMSLALVNVIQNQQKEVAYLSAKLGSVGLKSQLTGALVSNNGICINELQNSASGLGFTLGSNAEIPVNAIHNSTQSGAAAIVANGMSPVSDAPSLKVSSIKLGDFVAAGANFQANWIISFDTSYIGRPIAPIKVPVQLTASGGPNYTITSCTVLSSSTTSSSTGTNNTTNNGPPTYVLVGSAQMSVLLDNDSNWIPEPEQQMGVGHCLFNPYTSPVIQCSCSSGTAYKTYFGYGASGSSWQTGSVICYQQQ